MSSAKTSFFPHFTWLIGSNQWKCKCDGFHPINWLLSSSHKTPKWILFKNNYFVCTNEKAKKLASEMGDRELFAFLTCFQQVDITTTLTWLSCTYNFMTIECVSDACRQFATCGSSDVSSNPQNSTFTDKGSYSQNLQSCSVHQPTQGV
jgi:hypothetical protein